MSPEGGASASDLTVEQYAGISAAIADGYPLDAVLANEGLAPKAWPGADIAWKQKLVADPAAFESYRRWLGEAEDWLGRKVTPLDEDLAAWLGFLGAYAAHAAPFDLLGGLGLGMSDLGRLQRRWSKRLAEDQELAKEAAELAKAKPSAVPRVTAGRGVLTPFPWSKKGAPDRASSPEVKAAGAGAGAGTSADEDFDLAQYAALLAELTIAPKEKARALQRHGLVASSLAALRARWDARIAADAALAQDYRRLFAHHRARFEAAQRSANDRPRHEAPAPAPAFAAHPDLVAAPAQVAAAFAPKEDALAGKRAPSRLAETALAVDVPRGPSLPFTQGIAPKEIAEGTPDEPKAKRSSLGETALAVDVPRGSALPFPGETKAAPAPQPAPRPAPSPLAGTSLAVDVPRGPALPFDPTARPAPGIATPAPHEAKAQRAPVNLGGTSLAVDVPRGPSLPFASREATEPQRGSSVPAPPPAPAPAPKRSKLGELQLGMEIPKNLPRPRSAYAPPLTLEQHASLAVELAASPEKTAETLARYRLTPEARAELDAHYREKITASADTRAAWERAYQSYHAWLAANRRSAR